MGLINKKVKLNNFECGFILLKSKYSIIKEVVYIKFYIRYKGCLVEKDRCGFLFRIVYCLMENMEIK